jgi:hypothetical protein
VRHALERRIPGFFSGIAAPIYHRIAQTDRKSQLLLRLRHNAMLDIKGKVFGRAMTTTELESL